MVCCCCCWLLLLLAAAGLQALASVFMALTPLPPDLFTAPTTSCRSLWQGTLSDYKNELLFSEFGLNYSTLLERFRKVGRAGEGEELAAGVWLRHRRIEQGKVMWQGGKSKHRQNVETAAKLTAFRLPQGSVVIRQRVRHTKTTADGRTKEKERLEVTVLHCDIIRDAFWKEHPQLLA